MTTTNTPDLRNALELAEAALSDIGDANREPGDDLAWCEARAAKDLPAIRAALATSHGRNACHVGLALVALRMPETLALRNPRAQESLGVEFEKVLHDNLFDLYEESPHTARLEPARADSVQEDAARWEFRWLNPANNLHVAPSDLGWKTVNSTGMRSEKEVLEDLQAYRYQGKPVYEVRPLFATRALEKPEIRCPVRLANGGDCPRHNLQCGWPDCNKESK